MFDPAERFTVVFVTRNEIAEELNEYLDNMGLPNPNPMTGDDARLTNDVCKKHADDMPCGDLDYEEEFACNTVRTLKAVGMLAQDWEPSN